MNRLRTQVVAGLEHHRSCDQREEASRLRALAAVRALPAPFDRHADAVHVTGSGIVTGPRGVLLLRHLRLGIWVQPGGHLETGEAPWDAARRETTEETGIEVRLERPEPELLHVDVHEAGTHTHLDLRYRCLVVDEDEPRPPPEESPDVRWTPWSEALERADPGLRGLLVTLAPPA